MSWSAEQYDEFAELLTAMSDGGLSTSQAERLSERMRGDPSAQQLYLDFVELHTMMAWQYQENTRPQTRACEPTEDNRRGCGSLIAENEYPGIGPSPTSPLPPIIIETLPATNSSVSSFVGSTLFSYLMAAVIVGIGLTIAAVWKLSGNAQVAQQSAPLPSPLSSLPSAVGRITAMVDCVWDKEGLGIRDWGLEGGEGRGTRGERREISDHSPLSTRHYPLATVSLGDVLALKSGLLELTYDTGARVILQGPVTYKVDSVAGGHLAIGKLTARLEKRGQGTGDRGQGAASDPSSSNRSSLSTDHYPLSTVPNPFPAPRPSSPAPTFAVRTPTAIVTDLGTEFGVEVDENGMTESHVFVGKVRFETKGKSGATSENILYAGQAMRAVSGAATATMAVFQSSQTKFVRSTSSFTTPSSSNLIGQLDYSDTWSANSPTRAGSCVLLDTPESSQMEDCHGNPLRSWVFSKAVAVTCSPTDNPPSPWPGHRWSGSKFGFLESGGPRTYLGFEYGLRDDFVVQFDAVQPLDRVNITISDKPATIRGEQSLSVFFRAHGAPFPEIGVYTPSHGEADTGLHSGIDSPSQWHNYAVRVNLREKRIGVWVDRQYRGVIDLAVVARKSNVATWANLPGTNRYVTVGGAFGILVDRFWMDNFGIGSPAECVVRENETVGERDGDVEAGK